MSRSSSAVVLSHGNQARVTTAGLLRVEFRDFFLGDQLTSVYYALYNIGFLVCVYHRNWEGVPPACSTNETWASPILAALPNFWRFGQSLRRFVDSDGNQYASTLAQALTDAD